MAKLLPGLVLSGWAVAASAEQAAPLDTASVAALLEKPCGACHIATTAKGGKPVDALLSDAVLPGFADGSPLIDVLYWRHDGRADVRPYWRDWPSADDIARIARWIDSTPPKPSSPTKPDVPDPPRLALSVSPPSPLSGDVVTIEATAKEACHLTIVSVDAEGQAIVLVPNAFEPETLIPAGASRTVPGPDAAYRLRARELGDEMLFGWCTGSPAPLAGVVHAYGNQRFTILGAWTEARARMVAQSITMETRRIVPRRGTPAPQSLFQPHARTVIRFTIRPRN